MTEPDSWSDFLRTSNGFSLQLSWNIRGLQSYFRTPLTVAVKPGISLNIALILTVVGGIQIKHVPILFYYFFL